MRFSVAIPVLGQAQFLPTALASLDAQEAKFKVGVMDATPDNSVQLVLEHWAGPIGYSRHGPDEGQAAAIQEGWNNVGGDILYWLCADDYLFPFALREVAEIFDEHPEVDVVYGDSVFVNEHGDFLTYFPAISEDISNITSSNCISQPSCFVRRSAVDSIGGLDNHLHYIMDWDLWTRLFAAGAKFKYVNRPWSVVRHYPGTKTSSHSKRRLREIRRHLMRHAPTRKGLRTLVSLYVQRAEALRDSWGDRLLASAWGHYRRYRGARAAPESPLLYGMRAATGDVASLCELHLPWYANRPPRRVTISYQGVGPLDALINDSLLELTEVGEHAGMMTASYRIVTTTLNTNYFRLDLASKQHSAWRFILANIE